MARERLDVRKGDKERIDKALGVFCKCVAAELEVSAADYNDEVRELLMTRVAASATIGETYRYYTDSGQTAQYYASASLLDEAASRCAELIR